MTREVISYIIKLRLLDSFLEETIFSLCLSSVLNKSRLLRMSQSSVTRRKRLIQCPGWLECNERVLNRFYEIRDFPYLKLGIRELRAKSRRDSGLKVCGRVRMPEMTLGITGLKDPIGKPPMRREGDRWVLPYEGDLSSYIVRSVTIKPCRVLSFLITCICMEKNLTPCKLWFLISCKKIKEMMCIFPKNNNNNEDNEKFPHPNKSIHAYRAGKNIWSCKLNISLPSSHHTHHFLNGPSLRQVKPPNWLKGDASGADTEKNSSSPSFLCIFLCFQGLSRKLSIHF